MRRESMRAELLQRTDTLRSALLSSVSHDLRTPLATIKTSATSLLQTRLAWDEQMLCDSANAIVQEADHLNRLVENLLDMSRIEAGSLHLEKVWCLPDELVRDVLVRMEQRLQGHPLHVQIEDNLPPVELDMVQIDQVITNL